MHALRKTLCVLLQLTAFAAFQLPLQPADSVSDWDQVEARVRVEADTCTVEDSDPHPQPNRVLLNGNESFTIEKYHDENLYKISALNHRQLDVAIQELCGARFLQPLGKSWRQDQDINLDEAEVFKIIDSGPSENRIDVVFMGDGYASHERARFLQDMNRLATDMWKGDTFRSVTPFVNVWAVYVPSVDSGILRVLGYPTALNPGIGTNGRAKNTPFGLYRDGTELRGVYCSKRRAARAACRKTGPKACDYPSLIGNDDFYGGLGGEFTITTRSILSGTVVLRHEMGHNFISVGEEYDGGQVYSGVNAARSLQDIHWEHWLTEPGKLKEEKQALILQQYPWVDLAKGVKRYSFTSRGVFPRWTMKISASGVESNNSLQVYLDGVQLDWKPRGDLDRSFYSWDSEAPFSKGIHTLEFKGLPPSTPSSPIRQICSVEIHEFENAPRFHENNTFISAYPTFDMYGRKTYRPTNEGCLMRDMLSTSFCSVCQEGLWLRFLERVDLIDGLNVTQNGDSTFFQLELIALAHLRPKLEQVSGESYAISWFQENEELMELRNVTDFSRDSSQAVGAWKVLVKFSTPEIRKDSKGLTSSSRDFVVT
ncbi:MAG: hypothetical protein SGCHY_000669 [Lobulomycetales sp.]